MKNLPILLAAWLFAFAPAFAQKPDYRAAYFPHIHLAEMAIVAEDFNTALDFYQSAFNAVNNGFARDYHNAALCAMKTGQPDTAFDFFEKMALKGVTMEHFSKPEFAPLHVAAGWLSFQNRYPDLHKQHLETTDWGYRETLSAMHNLDQEFRIKKGSYAVYRDTIRILDSLNIKRFFSLVATRGFPSEERIGTDFPGLPVYNIVLLHHAQHLSIPADYPGWPELSDMLVAAIQAGEIDPFVSVQYLAMQNRKPYNLVDPEITCLRIEGKGQPEYYLNIPSDKAAANSLRINLGLEPVDEFINKCIYRLEYPNTPFKLNFGYLVTIDGDEALFAGIRKALFWIK